MEDMGLRDDDIQHLYEDAIEFFNESYGLDFSLSPPNEPKECLLENATLSLYRLHDRCSLHSSSSLKLLNQ